MEKLLALACKQAQQAEVWSTASQLKTVTYEDSKLIGVETSLYEGISLRVIKDGRIGSTFTTNLHDPAVLIQQAIKSSEFGGEAPSGRLPSTRLPIHMGAGVKSIEGLDAKSMANEAERYLQAASRLTQGTLNVSVQAKVMHTRLLNSSGTDLSSTISHWDFVPRILFDGTYSGVGERMFTEGFKPFEQEDLEFACKLHQVSKKEASLNNGRMPVIFMPEAAFMIHWRVMSAADASSLFQKTSPFEGKVGQKVFSELISYRDDPDDVAHPSGQPFDDEGTQAAPLTIIDKGVFCEFFTDLLHAERLNLRPNGRSFRGAGILGSDRLSGLPKPWLPNPAILPGRTPFKELLIKVDRSLVVFDLLGAHSGNIPNGDFSVGVGTGFLVEKGEYVGRIKDVMLTGNVHELLRRVRAVGDKTGPSLCGYAPPILVDDVSVATSNS
ncbi:MAG: TldD/PmbA family protein [Candidatus Riflebacteria bacterium]|nr:TldD/PmbA family protein [Candidatus Riflebacteria bacterium]